MCKGRRSLTLINECHDDRFAPHIGPMLMRGTPLSAPADIQAVFAPLAVMRADARCLRGRSSVRYGTRLGDLKENWFLLFSN